MLELEKSYDRSRLAAWQTSMREQLARVVLRPWTLLGIGSGNSEQFRAVGPITATISAGERIGLLGHNGSGKSTLLRVLAQVTPPSAGRAEIRGRVASVLEVGTGFHPELTGAENVYLSGAALGLRRSMIAERYQEIAAFAELSDKMDIPVKRYSSGMYVRLAFAIAAHLDPDVLLIDEVLAVGDEGFRSKCLQRMEAHATDGRTVVLVSHDMEAIRNFCTRCLVLEAGMVVFDGAPFEAIECYRKHRIQEE